MATRREANVVHAAGLVQGVVLATFPAASTIFTDPAQYAEANSLEDVTKPSPPPTTGL
jgi:hypothetical protein